MSSWQVALVVLAGVLVGAAIPVLYQTFAALRSLRLFTDATRRRLDPTLLDVSQIAARVNRATVGLEKGVDRGARDVEAVIGEVRALARGVNQIMSSVRLASTVGAAVAPAVASVVQAWRAPAGDSHPQVHEIRIQSASAEPGAGKGERG